MVVGGTQGFVPLFDLATCAICSYWTWRAFVMVRVVVAV
jgi:hypothetical protein